MTRKEVIEVLKNIYNYTRFDTYTTNEARTMARQKWCIVQQKALEEKYPNLSFREIFGRNYRDAAI